MTNRSEWIQTTKSIILSFIIYSLFLLITGSNPIEVFKYMYLGAFGSIFSIQNTILMAIPIILVTFCTALPAKFGMVVIGGEGALVLGGLAAATAGNLLTNLPPLLAISLMLLSAFIVGGLWISLVAVLKIKNKANETIVSLLLTYIAIALFNHLVEGPLRDPASLNKPSTFPLPKDFMLKTIFDSELHYGLIIALFFIVFTYILFDKSVFGFKIKVLGGNEKAARLVGLPINSLILITFFLAGGIAALAGAVDVMAIHGSANSSLIAGYGFTGVLVSFLARHESLNILPFSILMGAFISSNGIVQRNCELPDASLLIFQGIILMCIIGKNIYSNLSFSKLLKPIKS